MHSREIRSSFLEYFERNGHTIVASSSLVPARRPDAAVHQRRDEPVQGRVPRQGEARLHARDDLAEVHARQRQAQRPRQRRPVAPASHLLRDARQLLLRRLLQEGRDPLRLGAADRRSGSLPPTGCTRPSSRARPASRATTRRSTIWTTARARRSHHRARRWPRTSGRWARPARAAAARRSTTSAAPRCRAREDGGELPRPRVRLRPLRRGLEQRVHGVRPPGGRHAAAAARAVDRHRHGPRAHHGGASRASCRTTTRTSSRRSSTRSASRAGRPYTAPAPTIPPTSRCASSPITCAP